MANGTKAAAGATKTIQVLREEYRRRIERLAEQCRPRFESGELHGFTSEDGEKEWEDDRARVRDIEAGKPNRGPLYVAPIWRWEKEIERSMVRTFAQAYVILACSPSEKGLDGGAAIGCVKNLAAQCVTWDVMRIARARRWYRPRKDEEPSSARLAVAA